MNIYNQVISIANRPLRRQHVIKGFTEQKIPFEFYDALIPSDELNRLISEFVPTLIDNPSLSEIEKACFMSHLMVWNKAIELNLPFVAVFEDDLILSKKAHQSLKDYHWVHERFKENMPWVIKLETFNASVSYKKDTKILEYYGRYFAKMFTPHVGCCGYIISKSAILKLLQAIKMMPAHKIKAIDLLIFNGDFMDLMNIPTRQMVPAICIQVMHHTGDKNLLPSDIETSRVNQHRLLKKRLNLYKKICREMSRLKVQFKAFIRNPRSNKIVPFQ